MFQLSYLEKYKNGNNASLIVLWNFKNILWTFKHETSLFFIYEKEDNK